MSASVEKAKSFILLPEDRARKALDFLEDKYSNQKYYLNFSNPLELMVAAILSAQTRDTVVNALTPALFKEYSDTKAYADAKESGLLKYIGKVTFAENKARNIISACKILVEEYSGKVPKTMYDLLKLPGVGRKTANTILINAYDIAEGIPVDTWVIKLSGRIGLSNSKKPDDIEKDLMKLIDKSHWRNIAYVLKAHGHDTCHSVSPLCSICVIKDICSKNGVVNSK